MPIIEVKHLTKEYDLGTITSLKDSLRHTLAKIQGKDTWQRERFKALDDVNFTIEEGEVVGIIGHNGAGKSTLLKHLANITKPTSGEVIVRGSIAPLIEVGAGVNPELTGRENIFLNGAILGIPKKVIASKLDEIIDFSELEQFIDTPVKRYSSGMAVKLGFSIATSIKADILIVDEVLAVGDLAFQKKCYDRMEHMIYKENTTVLIVGHNIRQLERMCERMILLERGGIKHDGIPSEVCNEFYIDTKNKIDSQTPREKLGNMIPEDSTGDIQVLSMEFFTAHDPSPTANIKMHEQFSIKIKFISHIDLDSVDINIGIHTTDFVYITKTASSMLSSALSFKAGEHTIQFSVENLAIAPSTYGIGMTITDPRQDKCLWYAKNIKNFEITAGQVSASRLPVHPALVYLPFTWQIPTLDIDELATQHLKRKEG
ncbi:MAG: polysaccharide/polyol phosphate ABC transporter ATP-binding protein [Cellvibrionales bacterium]|nr:MAG: polysaccharide/polyol phosphate ABC transporter ATP-binding protein [Cellvibrionales bacterium]